MIECFMVETTRRDLLKFAGLATGVATTLGGIYSFFRTSDAYAQRTQSSKLEKTASSSTTQPSGNKYKTDNLNNDSENVLLARMLFGEARNCSQDEKTAIAYTAVNRANDGKKWNGTTVKTALLTPSQYSCFNLNDPNRKKLMDPEKYDVKSWKECLAVAEKVLSGEYSDSARATHYHTQNILPSWAKSDKMVRIGRIGNSSHIFYREK